MDRRQRKLQRDLVRRWEGNPIIALEDIPFQCSDVRNAGAVKIGKEYILLIDIEDLKGHQAIYKATSNDGYRFKVDKKPFLALSEESDAQRYADIGIMDPRITPLEGQYYITYTAESHHGFTLALARTKDFKKVKHLGYISQPDTKGGALFPEKINGRYARLERPGEGGRIWISYSDDLVYWGSPDIVLSPRAGYWDYHRIGCAVPPTRIGPNGEWLLIYYGEKHTSAGSLFRIGAAFLDAKDPSKVVSRTNIPILSPREYYERVGDVGNLVFSCGAILENKTLMLYYGAANSCICLGTVSIKDIMNSCIESEREF